jgi:hypothetical protein
MSIIAQNLEELTVAVGPEKIAHLPALEDVEVFPQSEYGDAVAYKILYGTGAVLTAEPDLDKIWIYLIPFPNKPHELRFTVCHNNDETSSPTVYDGQYLGRIVEEQSGPSIAFGNVTKNRKMHSLAKYYFPALMHQRGSKDEELKAPFKVTKTWVEELKNVCMDFAP